MDSASPEIKLAILGSTGSIGQQTLNVVRELPHKFKVVALAAASNATLLIGQIKNFQPDYYFCRDSEINSDIKCKFLPLNEMAVLPDADIIVMAISGTDALVPTLTAVRAGKTVALANKESLVMAGEIITEEVKKSGAQILPVDSEHSAIWQCLQGESRINKLILTASGGPFRNYSTSEMHRVTADQALRHPSWQMGKKITIDSATLMNKGLEIIEAHWLFDVPMDRIQVVIHPQSIIHSMVEFVDGSIKAQLSCPDMRLPILYALTYPDRSDFTIIPRLDWTKIKEMTFDTPDTGRFPCLKLAVDAGEKGGTYPAVLCSADEAAVNLFLNGRIRFTDIADLVANVLTMHQNISSPDIQDILVSGNWAKDKIQNLVEQ